MTVPRAYHRAFISPLLGGRMVADGGSAPIGGRSADACPYKSERQAEVAGWPRSESARHRRRSRRCRDEAETKPPKIVCGRRQDWSARHRDAGAVSGRSGSQAGGHNLSPRRPKRFLVVVERSGTTTKNARTWKDVGINRRTE